MSKLTTAVVCSVCGKTLRGVETPVGFSVATHTQLTPQDDRPAWARPKCPGGRKLNHQPVKR